MARPRGTVKPPKKVNYFEAKLRVNLLRFARKKTEKNMKED